ncbi:MAG TPA: VacJ family lipoprotein, partial [Candidatus Dormibacteraeota bacterium]|nr:VacJ family lipoprotein [Candidatus Dormibacteraeota bacterium]
MLSLCLLLSGGCAAVPPSGTREPRDPWERMNRATYRFNDALDRAILKPVARGYRDVTPRVVQTGVSHFFDNVEYPIVMLNDLLQGEFRPLLSDTGRLLLNTTIGIGGLLDPATAAGLEKNDRDFGQTLGKWGLASGPYFVIPILGPSDVRDTFGRVADTFSDPPSYL